MSKYDAETLLKQRDELLAAVETVLALFYGEEMDLELDIHIEDLRAIVARIKREGP